MYNCTVTLRAGQTRSDHWQEVAVEPRRLIEAAHASRPFTQEPGNPQALSDWPPARTLVAAGRRIGPLLTAWTPRDHQVVRVSPWSDDSRFLPGRSESGLTRANGAGDGREAEGRETLTWGGDRAVMETAMETGTQGR